MKAELLIPRMSLNVSLLFVLFISGVVAQDGWRVNYYSKSICSLKGSAVIMDCTYTPPSGHSVQKAFWTKELVTSGSEPPDLLDDPEYSGRVQYLGDEQGDCTLRFKTVREKDQSKYYFTFITDRPGGKYQGAGGVDLSVTDLQVEVPERVIEGGDVTLTCKTTCSLTVRPTFTWYRNGRPLSSGTDQLRLQPVNSDNKDRYHCAVLGLSSPEVPLNVRYGPKSVSVSISPSGEIVEGRSVNLTCSSDANPPVKNYTWFKEGGSSPVGSGHGYRALQSGSYYCVAQNEHGSQKSAAVTVIVKGVWNAVLFAVLGMVAGCGCFFAIIAVLCVRRKRKCDSATHADQKEENIYSNVTVGAATTDTAPDPDLSNQDDVYYASPVPAARKPDSAFGPEEEVQYASIQFHCDKVVEKTEGDSTEYASVRFTHTSANNRSATSMTEDPSVIYSTME